MTYAANLGRDHIIRLLHGLGATDLESAAGRAALQGKTDTVRLIHDLAGRPLDKWTLAGPAYTLSVEGTAVLLALGARVVGPEGVDRGRIRTRRPRSTPTALAAIPRSSRRWSPSATSVSTTARDSRTKRASRASCLIGRRPECPGVHPGTPRGGTRRRTASRVPRRHAARLGRAVPCEDLREPGVASVDRGPGRRSLTQGRLVQ
jgi:hypothetical protein